MTTQSIIWGDTIETVASRLRIDHLIDALCLLDCIFYRSRNDRRVDSSDASNLRLNWH